LESVFSAVQFSASQLKPGQPSSFQDLFAASMKKDCGPVLMGHFTYTNISDNNMPQSITNIFNNQ